MDDRTKKRLVAQYDMMTHLLQRHFSRLPRGKSLAEVLHDGVMAALALGMVEVEREARFEARRAMPKLPQQPIGRGVDALLAPVTIVASCVPSESCDSIQNCDQYDDSTDLSMPPPTEQWGIGCSLPAGDA